MTPIQSPVTKPAFCPKPSPPVLLPPAETTLGLPSTFRRHHAFQLRLPFVTIKLTDIFPQSHQRAAAHAKRAARPMSWDKRNRGPRCHFDDNRRAVPKFRTCRDIGKQRLPRSSVHPFARLVNPRTLEFHKNPQDKL